MALKHRLSSNFWVNLSIGDLESQNQETVIQRFYEFTYSGVYAIVSSGYLLGFVSSDSRYMSELVHSIIMHVRITVTYFCVVSLLTSWNSCFWR